MLQFTADHKQSNLLKGLAYWIADRAYLSERYGHDEPEIIIADEAIHTSFDECDALKIPYWVQNNVIIFAENWRRYKSEYMTEYLKKKNIKLA